MCIYVCTSISTACAAPAAQLVIVDRPPRMLGARHSKRRTAPAKAAGLGADYDVACRVASSLHHPLSTSDLVQSSPDLRTAHSAE